MIKKPFQIEINKEQSEWEVVQTLTQLGLQKTCWNNDLQTVYVEVYLGLGCFINRVIDAEKCNVLTLSDFTNLLLKDMT